MAAGEDYGAVYESFDWDSVLESYDWDAPEELNMAHEACDRYAGSGEVGFAWVSESGDLAEYTFAELRDWSNRVANALTELGVERGDPGDDPPAEGPGDDRHRPRHLEGGRDTRPALHGVREGGAGVPHRGL